MQKSHKKDNGENDQIRSHAPTGTKYGEEKGGHPNRQVSGSRTPTSLEAAVWRHENPPSGDFHPVKEVEAIRRESQGLDNGRNDEWTKNGAYKGASYYTGL